MMENRILAASAVGVAAMLILANYQGLSDYAEYRAAHSAIAGLEPVFEPRVVEPLVEHPVIDTVLEHPVGYVRAEHHPKDDSVTLTHADNLGGGDHAQRYLPGQTFVYRCYGDDDRTRMFLYQYRGTGLFQGNRYMSMVHFELDAPPGIACKFPDHLTDFTDVYDAGSFDRQYGLEFYVPRHDPGNGHAAYAEPVKNAVRVTPVYIDPLPTRMLDEGTFRHEFWIEDIVHNGDDSITVTYRNPSDGGLVPGTGHSQTYAPGQTFLVYCEEHEDHSYVHIYNYRGSEDLRGSEILVRVNFGAYTKAPMPCTYPDVLEETVDAFDTSRFDRQYDMEWYREPLGAGFGTGGGAFGRQ